MKKETIEIIFDGEDPLIVWKTERKSTISYLSFFLKFIFVYFIFILVLILMVI